MHLADTLVLKNDHYAFTPFNSFFWMGRQKASLYFVIFSPRPKGGEGGAKKLIY
jgi:hypothetical protein